MLSSVSAAASQNVLLSDRTHDADPKPLAMSASGAGNLSSSSHISSARVSTFAEKILFGLTDPVQKSLPQEACYNQIGSALFNVRMLLPEYGVTRAETRVLNKHAADIPKYLPTLKAAIPLTAQIPGTEAFRRSAAPCLRVVDLGCGSGVKTRIILDALQPYGQLGFHPIDISPAALSECSNRMHDMTTVSIQPYNGEFMDGIRAASDARVDDEPLLVLFLGSTIGQFHDVSANQFFEDAYAALRPGDALLIGADLMKDSARLIAAYGHCMGLTHVQMHNMFNNVNETVGADLNIDHFEAITQLDEPRRTVERFMRAKCSHVITLGMTGDALPIKEGETIKVYSGRKFLNDEIENIGRSAGFSLAAQWVDDEWAFGETLLIRDKDA